MNIVRTSSLPLPTLRFLAAHLVAEFGHLYPEWKPDMAVSELAHDPGSGLPVHLGAIDDENIIGVASIIPDDEVTGWESKEWWLANVLVLPEYRGRGIGKELINQVILTARASGARDLHLVTETADTWYLKQGWQNVGTGTVHGHQMVVMHYQLSSRKRS